MEDYKVVQTFLTRVEAEAALILMEENKIEGVIDAKDAGGMIPTVSANVRILVNPKDLKKAQKLLGVKKS